MKLILVYNAEEGLFNAVTDTIHKVLSPSTYSCRLCSYTYGMMGMLRPWRTFLYELPYDKEFYHRRQFARRFPHEATTRLPAIYLEHGEALQLVVGADRIEECQSLDELIGIVRKGLERASGAHDERPVGTD